MRARLNQRRVRLPQAQGEDPSPSPPGLDIALGQATDLARVSVPYYREACARAGRLTISPPTVTRSELDRLLPLLYPVDAPYRRDREPPPDYPDVDRLATAMALTGGHQDGRPVIDLRSGLVDAVRCGSSPYRVITMGDPPPSPAVRREQQAAWDWLTSADSVTVTGSAADLDRLAGHLGGLGPHITTIERRPLGLLGDGPTEVGAIGVEPILGPVAAYRPGCGCWHLVPHLRVGPSGDGLELADVARRRPTLLRYRPEQGRAAWIARCPVNGQSVFRAGPPTS